LAVVCAVVRNVAVQLKHRGAVAAPTVLARPAHRDQPVWRQVVLAVRSDPLDHGPLDRHRAEYGQQRSQRPRRLEAAVGEQPVIPTVIPPPVSL